MVRNYRYNSNKIIHLGVYLDKHFLVMSIAKYLQKKLNRANGSQVWGQSSETVLKKDTSLAEKAVRIMTFSDCIAHTNPIFKE